MSSGHFQDLGERAMEIMRGLRAGPDGQLSLRILDGHRSVLPAIDAQSLLVLADGKNPVLDGKVFPRQHEIHSRVSGGARRVDFSNARMRMRRPQQLAVRHSRQENVVGEARLAGHLRAGIDSAARDTDYAKFTPVGLWSFSGCLSAILFTLPSPSRRGVPALVAPSTLQHFFVPPFS